MSSYTILGVDQSKFRIRSIPLLVLKVMICLQFGYRVTVVKVYPEFKYRVIVDMYKYKLLV